MGARDEFARAEEDGSSDVELTAAIREQASYLGLHVTRP
jgi:hypothetical protein